MTQPRWKPPFAQLAMAYQIEVALRTDEDTEVWCNDAAACGLWWSNAPRPYGVCAADMEGLALLYPDREYRIEASAPGDR